jgi:hypothetical protein
LPWPGGPVEGPTRLRLAGADTAFADHLFFGTESGVDWPDRRERPSRPRWTVVTKVDRKVRASEVFVLVDVLRKTAAVLTRLFDITATKDWANCAARADVVVDGRTLLREVPVAYLLFLEKQLTDLYTFVKKLPLLDAAEDWRFEESADYWRTEPVRTIRTKKVPRNHVKAEVTEKHPAQVEVYYEDIAVGYWTTVKFSGALPARRVNELLDRVEKLQHAVKFAREEANSMEITDQRTGEVVFGYLFG